MVRIEGYSTLFPAWAEMGVSTANNFRFLATGPSAVVFANHFHFLLFVFLHLALFPAWAMGAATGHTAVALWREGTLQVGFFFNVKLYQASMKICILCFPFVFFSSVL